MSVADVKCPNIGIGPAASDESGLTQVDRMTPYDTVLCNKYLRKSEIAWTGIPSVLSDGEDL